MGHLRSTDTQRAAEGDCVALCLTETPRRGCTLWEMPPPPLCTCDPVPGNQG